MSTQSASHEHGQILNSLQETVKNTKLVASEMQERSEKMNERMTSIDEKNQEIFLKQNAQDDFQKSMETKFDDLQRAFYDSTGTLPQTKEKNEEHQKCFEDVIMKRLNLVKQETHQKFVRTDIDPLGGFLAPNDFQRQVVEKIVEVSPIRQNANVLNTTRGLVEVPVDNVTEEAFWVGEAEIVPESQPTFDLVSIPINKQGAVVSFTQEALEDNVVNLLARIQNNVVRKFSQSENRAFLNGNTVKRPEGILTNGDIFKLPSSTPNDYTAEDVVNLEAEPKTGYKLAYYMQRKQLAKVRTLTDAGGRFIYQSSIEKGRPVEINGTPVFLTPDMTKTFSAGEIPIMVADLSIGYEIYDRTGLFVRMDDITEWRKGKVSWIFFMRLGGAVVQPEAFAFLEVSS